MNSGLSLLKYPTLPNELGENSLVSIRVGNPIKGVSFTILLEHCIGVDYCKMSLVINRMVISSPKNAEKLGKSCAQMLLSMAQSDRESLLFTKHHY